MSDPIPPKLWVLIKDFCAQGKTGQITLVIEEGHIIQWLISENGRFSPVHEAKKRLGIENVGPMSDEEMLAIMDERWKALWLRKAQESTHLAKGIRFAILQRDNFTCRYCGNSASSGALLQVDHLVPQTKGGETKMENLVTACWECNVGKGATSLSQRNTSSIKAGI